MNEVGWKYANLKLKLQATRWKGVALVGEDLGSDESWEMRISVYKEPGWLAYCSRGIHAPVEDEAEHAFLDDGG